LIENKSADLYGGLLGWPFHHAGPLRLNFVLFFLVEGAASIMFGIDHRRYFFNALGVYVRKRCGGHYFGQHQ
jgi:hypothetical protein